MVAIQLYNATNGAENVTTASVTTGAAKSFGLFANFVGGDLDELFGQSEVGVWRGRGIFEVLAPAFDDAKDIAGNTTALATAYTAIDGTGPKEVYLGSNADARLAQDPNAVGPEGFSLLTDTAAHWKAGIINRGIARLVDRLSATAILIELLA